MHTQWNVLLHINNSIAQGSSYVGQNKHKAVFGFNPTHHLWELRWNFLFSPLPAMHFTAYNCELVKSFQRSYLEGNQRTGKQLQTNTNGWKTCLWNMGRKGDLCKGHHSFRIPFQSDCTKAARFSEGGTLNFNTELHPSSSWLFTDISIVLSVPAGTEEQQCCPCSVILKKGGNKHLFYWIVILLHIQIPWLGSRYCMLSVTFIASASAQEKESLKLSGGQLS